MLAAVGAVPDTQGMPGKLGSAFFLPLTLQLITLAPILAAVDGSTLGSSRELEDQQVHAIRWSEDGQRERNAKHTLDCRHQKFFEASNA
jgi:hypothetical protein